MGRNEALAISIGLVVVFLVPLATVVGATVHEVGHAVAARLAGMYIDVIRLGGGRLLVRTKVGSIPVELRGVTWRGPTGMCLLYPRRISGARMAIALSILGGPLANVCLALPAFALAAKLVPSRDSAIGDAVVFLGAVVWVILQLPFALGTLVPWTTRAGKTALQSDGLRLLRLPRLPQAALDSMVARGLHRDASRQLELGALDGADDLARAALTIEPGMVVARYIRAVVSVRRGRPLEAAAMLRPLVALVKGSGLEGHVRSDLALCLLLAAPMKDAATGARPQDALEHARAATLVDPNDAAFALVFAAAQIAAGAHDEGSRLLKPTGGLPRSTPPWARALYACLRARALVSLGRGEEAAEELRHAALADDCCSFVQGAASGYVVPSLLRDI